MALIAAASSTKNGTGNRDPQMHQTKTEAQRYFGMQARVGTNAYSRLVHTVASTAADISDVTQGRKLLHGES